MITSVHSVLVGKACPAGYSTVDDLNEGDVALFNEDGAILTSADAAAEATAVYVGVAGKTFTITSDDGSVQQHVAVEYSNKIQKASKPTVVIGEYSAPINEVVTMDLSSATINLGFRYVIRIVYKDIETPGFQFTHTYEVYATSDDASELAEQFVKKINQHKNRRVIAEANGAVITLTALDKDDNEGVYSLNEYSIVNMEASIYETRPEALVMNQPRPVYGAEIEKTEGDMGKGYWKIVRDTEVRNMGYKGHVFTGAYPVIAQELKVVEGAEYDYAIIEYNNLYLSNDNQYIKTTPLTVELYIESGSLVGSTFEEMLNSFIAA